MATEDDIITERRNKAEAMRGAGQNPYANDWKPERTLAEVRAAYAGSKPAEAKKGPIVPVDEQTQRVAGRVMAKRGFGKTVFVPLRDGSGDLQLYLNVDHCEDFERRIGWLDVGDIVGAEGLVFWTQKGELSILVKKLRILVDKVLMADNGWVMSEANVREIAAARNPVLTWKPADRSFAAVVIKKMGSSSTITTFLPSGSV